MPKLNTYFWIRIGVMALSFVAVIFMIWKLNQFSPADLTLVLCPTRVTAISTADGGGIVQEKMNWYRKVNGNLEELDPIAVEKWFGKYCKLEIEPQKKVEPGSVAFVVSFVNGNPETLYNAGEGTFRWGDRTFKSKKLEEAIASLKQLPLHLRPGIR